MSRLFARLARLFAEAAGPKCQIRIRALSGGVALTIEGYGETLTFIDLMPDDARALAAGFVRAAEAAEWVASGPREALV